MSLKIIDSGASVFVRYIGPTNTRPSRFKVWTDSRKPRFVPYDHGVNDPWAVAFEKYMTDANPFCHFIKCDGWAAACCPDGRTRAFIPIWDRDDDDERQEATWAGPGNPL